MTHALIDVLQTEHKAHCVVCPHFLPQENNTRYHVRCGLRRQTCGTCGGSVSVLTGKCPEGKWDASKRLQQLRDR